MAEWGKGDPRWIVEEREDGKNVNAWHWEEKDCSKWVKDRLDVLCKEISASSGENSVALTKVSKFDGEVNWYNRKGKLFTLYDLTMALDFEGKFNAESISGQLKIADFEQDAEAKADFRVSVSKGAADASWKTWARDALKAKFVEVWSHVVVELHDEQKSKIPGLNRQDTAPKMKLPEVVQKQRESSSPSSLPQTQSNISLSFTFQASPQDLWDLFTHPRKVEQYTQSRTSIDAKEGGFFSIYDGAISGCFLELKPFTEMRFAWRLKDWKEGVNSQVTIKFVKAKEGTKMELFQSNVPSGDVDRTQEGWKRYYFERWKGIFGYSY